MVQKKIQTTFSVLTSFLFLITFALGFVIELILKQPNRFRR